MGWACRQGGPPKGKSQSTSPKNQTISPWRMGETIASIHPAASHGLSVPAAAARENGHKVLAGCGCYSWGGKYMSDLITHTQDLGRSVGGGGRGRDGGKPRSIPSVVVVVGVGRILREPITVLKGELPPGRLRGGGGGVCCQCVSPRPPLQCAGALIGWPRTGRGKRLQRASIGGSLACFFALRSGRARCETHPPSPMKPLSSCATV